MTIHGPERSPAPRSLVVGLVEVSQSGKLGKSAMLAFPRVVWDFELIPQATGSEMAGSLFVGIEPCFHCGRTL